ncbi:exocyst complex component exo84 [Coemansia guatemalensis]|uniref:Exocyst complex component EXO84 n=1 Tax=Coemansia guatemalensis TaxID=2761395 RepID=A0A9W8HXJ6_9FUNG|nr:exocyst complex component exo84 [Coemansia guatemalensis]
MDGGPSKKSIRKGLPAAMRARAEEAAATAAPAGAAGGELPPVSLSKLTKPDFQAETYLKETLQTVQEKNIRQFRKSLEDARKAASKNLQKNVYRNYESFVFISKEISSMERDMQLLRELLHGINEVGDELMEEDEGSVLDAEEPNRIGRRRTMRMSMANQQDMFKDQLAKIWRTIRDAQRLVPFAPNRHVVGDVRNISELSPSTLQTRQKVDIVVFSDMILLAARKRRGNRAQTVLVADRSFELSNVTVADVGDASRSGFLVKIVNRAETFLFGFRSAEAKNELLLLISHARAGIFGADAPPPLPTASREAAVGGMGAAGNAEDEDAAAAAQRRRMDEQLDALDIRIARREFVQATELVQQLKEQLGAATKAPPAVQRAVDAHTAALARLILADLLIPCSVRKQVSENVALLHRLGWDKEAKGAFLASRTATIKNRTRQLKLEGNTRLYIRELAIVYFRLIRNTCEWYSALFADPTMISALIAWVRQEMAGYAAIFRRHVFHEMQRFQVIASCLNHTLAEVDILGHAGLDLKFMLDQEFFPDLTRSVRSYEARCLALLTKAVSEDNLAVVSKVSTTNYATAARLFGAQMPIVASVGKLDEVLTEFGTELRFIVRDSLYSQVVASVLVLIEGVLKQFLAVLRRGSRSYAQEFALLVSTQAVVSWVIPRAAAHLDRIFGRTVADIHNLEQRLEAFPASLQDVFCQKHAQAIARSSFDFVTASFADNDSTVSDSMAPSSQMESLLQQLGAVARELDQWPLAKRSVLSGIIDCLFVQMIDPHNWEAADGSKRSFGHYGVHRLVLDVHFLLRVCGSLVSKSTNNMANRVCEKALRSYFSAHHQSSAGAAATNKEMMNKSWYDARVLDTMRRLGFSFPDFGKGFEHRSQQSFDSAAAAAAAVSPTPADDAEAPHETA